MTKWAYKELRNEEGGGSLRGRTRAGLVVERKGLRSGFDPPDLDRPGRLPPQQGLCEARKGRSGTGVPPPARGAAGPE